MRTFLFIIYLILILPVLLSLWLLITSILAKGKNGKFTDREIMNKDGTYFKKWKAVAVFSILPCLTTGIIIYFICVRIEQPTNEALHPGLIKNIEPSIINLLGNHVDCGNDEFYRFSGSLITENGIPFCQVAPDKIPVVGYQPFTRATAHYIRQERPTSSLSEEYYVTPSFFSKIRSLLIRRGAWGGHKLIVDNATNSTFDISVDSFPTMKLPPLKHVAICFIGETNTRPVHELSLRNHNKNQKELIRLPILGKGHEKIYHLYNIDRVNRYYAYAVSYGF